MKTQVLLSSLFLGFDFETHCTGSYSTLCKINDNGQLANIATLSSDGSFYHIKYDIVLSFGLTELAAQFAWEENVSEQRLSFS